MDHHWKRAHRTKRKRISKAKSKRIAANGLTTCWNRPKFSPISWPIRRLKVRTRARRDDRRKAKTQQHRQMWLSKFAGVFVLGCISLKIWNLWKEGSVLSLAWNSVDRLGIGYLKRCTIRQATSLPHGKKQYFNVTGKSSFRLGLRLTWVNAQSKMCWLRLGTRAVRETFSWVHITIPLLEIFALVSSKSTWIEEPRFEANLNF